MSDGLSADSPAERVQAIEALRFLHLKDPAVLGRLLDLCADDAPAREAARDDPFAAFFQGQEATTEVRTVGDEAVARIDRAGLPRDAWPVLEAALTRHPTCQRLLDAAPRWAAETRWTDEIAALEALIPPLQAADVPLLAIVAAASPDGRQVLVRRALSPWNPRTLQELLNHNGAHHGTVEAIEAGIADGSLAPDADQALLLLGLLAGWESPAAPRLARALRERHPWASAYGSLDDADQLHDAVAWLEEGAPEAPPTLGWRLVEVLRQRPRIEGWPLARWVEHFDLGSEAFDAWGVDDEAEALLSRRLERLDADDDALRVDGWNAAGLLVAEDRHAGVLELLSRAVSRDLPWDGDFLSRLASGRPPVPGLAAALAAGIAVHDDPEPALTAAHDLDGAELEPVVDALLAWAATRPLVTSTAGHGLVREGRDGVDEARLRPLVERVDSPARRAAFAAIEPVVRSAEP